MSGFYLTLLYFSFIVFNSFSEGSSTSSSHESAVVVGTVYCDTCFSSASHFISGATVAVECKDGRFRQEVKTNIHGKFRVRLPFPVSKHVKTIEGCSVRLVKSSEPYCAVASSATSSSIHLRSRKQGTHVFSAGFFTFKPLNGPVLCSQKPSIHNLKQKLKNKPPSSVHPDQFLPPPVQGLPPVPGVIPPSLPVPPVPGVIPPSLPVPPLPPVPVLTPPTLPPTPELTPPSLPPVPGLNPPELPPLPPVPGLVPPSLPPIPVITPPPSTPSPAPPGFPLPLPPLPVPPLPPFPGVPPAKSSP